MSPTPVGNHLLRAIAPSFSAEFRYYTSDLDFNSAALLDVSANSQYAITGDWTQVTDYVTGTPLSQGWDMGGAVSDWSVTLRGQNYDPDWMGPEKCVLAMRRLYCQAVGWGNWKVWWCGWVDTMGDVFDDYRQGADWTVRVGSLSVFTKTNDAPARRYGRTNIALGKSATASSTLSDPVMEAGKGEFMGFPDVGASNAVDGNMDTLWISQNAPSTTEEVPSWPGNPPDYAINEVFREPIGYDETYRWFEIYCRNNTDGTGFQYLKIYSRSTGLTLDFAKQDNTDPEHPTVVTDILTTDNHAVLCYDERHFRELFDPGDTTVVEWRHLVCSDWSSGENWNYDPDGDVISIDAPWGAREVVVFGLANNPYSTLTAVCNPGATVMHLVSTAGLLTAGQVRNASNPNDAISYTGKTGTTLTGVTGVDSGSAIGTTVYQYIGWRSAPVGSPLDGESIRRDPAGTCTSADYSTAADFVQEEYPSPGRHHESGAEEWEWISVDLGTLSFQLAEELTTVQTTATVSPNTDGLTVRGSILMDGDVIDYGGKTITTLTGLSARTVTYPATTVFQQYEDGIATLLWPVRTIGWRRPQADNEGTAITPKIFALYASKEASPVYPPDDNWKTDWTLLLVHSYDGPYYNPIWETDVKARRCRHVMLVVQEMSDVGRVKINEVRIFPPEWSVTGGTNPLLEDGTIDKVFEYILVDTFGLNSAQVSTEYNSYVGPFETSETTYHALLAELARKSGLVLCYNRDPTISVVRDPSHAMHGATTSQFTFDRSKLLDVRYKKKWTRLRQVEVTARDPEAERTYIVRYPQSAPTGGQVYRVPTVYHVSSMAEARLIAERVYRFETMHEEVTLTPVGPVDDWIETLYKVRVNWDIEPDDDEIDSFFLVNGIDVAVDFPAADRINYSETIRTVQYVA